MLSEYQTIASAHFDLHNGLRQNFRFYLGLVAVPFTVFAVYKDVNLNLFSLPSRSLALFGVVPFLGLLMFLAMINTRFDIILYTRAVNAVRAYFVMRAERVGPKDLQEVPETSDPQEQAAIFRRVLARLYMALCHDQLHERGLCVYSLRKPPNQRCTAVLGPLVISDFILCFASRPLLVVQLDSQEEGNPRSWQ